MQTSTTSWQACPTVNKPLQQLVKGVGLLQCSMFYANIEFVKTSFYCLLPPACVCQLDTDVRRLRPD